MGGRAVEDEKEVFAREFDEGQKVFVKLVRTKNIQTRVVGRVLVALRMDVNSIESVGNDMIKFRSEEGSVFVVRTGGESMEVQGEDEARAGMEKEFLLPLGWMPSSGRCRCRTWARSGSKKQLLESLGSKEEIVVEQGSVFEFVIKSFQGRSNVAGRMELQGNILN